MIEITSKQVERINLILSHVPNGVEKALMGAIDRAKTTVRAKTTKSISEVYAITQKDIRAETNVKMRTQRAQGGIVGSVSFAGCKIPLFRFDTTPKTVTPGALVSAAVLRGNSPKPFRNAFIAQMEAGEKIHTGIFKRSGAARFPIEEFMGPSTAQMAGNSVVLEEVEAAAHETIEKRIEQEISRLLNGYGG